jgi:uncharacterized protein (DUF1499 family)
MQTTNAPRRGQTTAPKSYRHMGFAVPLPFMRPSRSAALLAQRSTRPGPRHGEVVAVCDLRSLLTRVASAAAAAAAATIVMLPQPAEAAILHMRWFRPSRVGVTAERTLARCRWLPNCVSSRGGRIPTRGMPRWTYNAAATAAGSDGSALEAKTMSEAAGELVGVIATYPRARLVTQRETNSAEIGKGYYVHAEFESPTLGFVDDVEFLFMPDNATVEFSAGARLGVSDFGVNRARINRMHAALQAKDKRWGLNKSAR